MTVSSTAARARRRSPTAPLKGTKSEVIRAIWCKITVSSTARSITRPTLVSSSHASSGSWCVLIHGISVWCCVCLGAVFVSVLCLTRCCVCVGAVFVSVLCLYRCCVCVGAVFVSVLCLSRCCVCVGAVSVSVLCLCRRRSCWWSWCVGGAGGRVYPPCAGPCNLLPSTSYFSILSAAPCMRRIFATTA